jgi:hypothetical protein
MTAAATDSHQDAWPLPSHVGDARGLYNPMQFVVRLHDDVHAELNTVAPGVGIQSVNPKQALALSTYFHEKIHWWQHVGSTLGLFLSLAYPAQGHVNYTRLKQLLYEVGPVKSLVALNQNTVRQLDNNAQTQLNIILNNWHDIEFCRWLAILPDRAAGIITQPYFDSIGHSYEITWGNVVLLIRGALDPSREFLPEPEDWEAPFADLRSQKVADYFYGSTPIRLSSIGARLIFEGQARFSQLQSIHFAWPDADWQSFHEIGMLGSDYTAAFRAFLALSGLSWPESPGGPEVALFLAVCDIAINPTEGWPFPIGNYAGFRANVDPGLRFVALSQAVASRKYLSALVRGFTRDEYCEVTETLVRDLGWHSPLAASAKVRSWEAHTTFQQLQKEDAEFRFANRDLPVRLFVARYLDFQRDKLLHPELMVWPGAFMGGREHTLSVATVINTYNRHEPLFVDVPGGEIRPALIAGRDYDAIYETFNTFYAYCATYQLVRQWHVTDGPFNLDFGWLGPTGRTLEAVSWAKDNFEGIFGRSIDDFEILEDTAPTA